MQIDTKIVSLNLRPAQNLSRSTTHSSLDIGACSHPGSVRENNEDAFLIAPDMNLFILSDGMGGLSCGEIASRLTVDAIVEYCRSTAFSQSEGFAQPLAAASVRLAEAVQWANQVVFNTAFDNALRRGMGATVVAIQCLEQGLSIAHVGDSRAYRLRNNDLQQLTEDHSFIAEQVRMGSIGEAEAGASHLRHMLTRAVGVEPHVDVTVGEDILLDGDTLLLCSDGLTRELSDVEIAEILDDAENSQSAAECLVSSADERGGHDNITAIVVRRAAKSRGIFSRIGRMSRWFSGWRR
jgi:PPM family protein phosphatase